MIGEMVDDNCLLNEVPTHMFVLLKTVGTKAVSIMLPAKR